MLYSLNHYPTCRFEVRQALIYQLVSGLTDENGKYDYAKAVHHYPPFFDISCSAKNYKIASALTIPGAHINGSMKSRLPGNVNCRFDGVEGEAVVIMLDLAGVCVSAGSACTSGGGEPSHVLTALGQSRRGAYGAIRITLAETNTEAEVEYIADRLASIVKDLRKK